MKKLLTALLFSTVFFLSSLPIFGASWDEHLYVVKESVTVAWDISEDATGYDIKPVWVDSEGVKHEYNHFSTSDTSITVYRPRGGFFVFYARSTKIVSGVNPETGEPWANNGETIVSEWIQSIDPNYATVDGQPKGWRVYFEVPAPASGGIE